jgi:DNA-binding ferritin-like protein
MTGKKADCGGCGDCGCGKGKEDPVWIDPSQYDILKDGPGYLPSQSQPPVVPVVVTAVDKQMARKASQVVAPMVAATMTSFQTKTADAEVFKGLPLVDLLNVLNAVAMIHHTCHWRTSGAQSYGDHLLFDRVYSDVSGHIDLVAERAIGLGAGPLVSADAIARGTLKVIEDFGSLQGALDQSSPEGLAQLSMEAAKVALAAVGVVIGAMNTAGNLTGGTENLLQGLQDKYEEHVYLLGQRLGG